VLRADGALAARRTGSTGSTGGGGGGDGGARVHLVGTAAGPLGGDVVEVDVRVGPGARLVLRGVAATLVLPHRLGGKACTVLRVHVAEGARLDLALEPVVVAAGADLDAVTCVEVADGGELDLTEQVVLGRWGEGPGRWRGTVRADLGGVPWLRQSVALGPGAPAWDALDAPRALVSRLRTPPPGSTPPAAAAGRAVLLPLALGGTLVEALGTDLGGARRDAAALAEPPEEAGSAGAAADPQAVPVRTG
jgi:urease accessory protein